MATALRDEPAFAFEILIDLCGVDYASYGKDEWATEESTSTGFSRGVEARTEGRLTAVTGDLVVEKPWAAQRFAVVYHLLSLSAEPAPAPAGVCRRGRRCRWCLP